MILVTGIDLPIGAAIAAQCAAVQLPAIGLAAELCRLPAERLAAQLSVLPGLSLIIHAFEDLDWFGAQQSPEVAHQLNVGVTEVIAEFASQRQVPVILLSSFLVFDGHKKNPYIAANEAQPLSVYGRTKWEAERRLHDRLSKALILRVGWVLDIHEDGWLDRQIQAVIDGRALAVAEGATFNPTPVRDIARVVAAIVRQLGCGIEVWGDYHYGASDAVTHAELVRAIGSALAGLLPGCAPRYAAMEDPSVTLEGVPMPHNGSLSCIKLRNTFGIKQRAWRTELPGLISARLEQLKTLGRITSVNPADSTEPTVVDYCPLSDDPMKPVMPATVTG